MKENQQEIVQTVKKPSYEPATVQVNVIAPVAVLCGSGGGGQGGFGMGRMSGKAAL